MDIKDSWERNLLTICKWLLHQYFLSLSPNGEAISDGSGQGWAHYISLHCALEY